MKKLCVLFLLCYLLQTGVSAQVGINVNSLPPDPSAMLDINSSNKGLLIPRTSTSSRATIVNPAKGLMLYDTTTNSFWYHNGTAWAELSSSTNGLWTNTIGSNIHNTNSGNVGINVANPGYNLDVGGYMHCTGTVYFDNNLILNGYLTTGGKGIVHSNTSAQQKIVRTSATLTLTNLQPYSYAFSGTLDYEDFTGVPTVSMGGVNNGNGGWHQVNVCPVNITATGCQFMIYNTSANLVSFTGVTWQVLIIGPQ